MNGMREELKSVLDEMIEKYVPERRRRGMGKLDEELAKLTPLTKLGELEKFAHHVCTHITSK